MTYKIRSDKRAAIARNLTKNLELRNALAEEAVSDEKFDYVKAIGLSSIAVERVLLKWLDGYCKKNLVFRFHDFYAAAKSLGIGIHTEFMSLDYPVKLNNISSKYLYWNNTGAANMRTIRSFEESKIADLSRYEISELFHTCVYLLPISFNDTEDEHLRSVLKFLREMPDLITQRLDDAKDPIKYLTRDEFSDTSAPRSYWEMFKSLFN